MSDPERWEHPIPGSDWRIVVEKYPYGETDHLIGTPRGILASGHVNPKTLEPDFEFWVSLKYTGPVPF